MKDQTATLSMTPWASAALSDDETREIAERAVDLHVRIGVGKGRRGWTIRVHSWAKDAHHDPIQAVSRHHQRGPLAGLLNGALDEYERLYGRWTPEELLSIAVQSGLEVSRA